MNRKISTCLWFDNDGEEAARFYVSLVPDSEITDIMRPEPGGPALVVTFTLAGTPFMALNGGPQFPQSEAASIVVSTEDQAETDRLWTALLEGGGNESQCGWLKDRFGVSWQVVPKIMIDRLTDPDRAAAKRAMDAMMTMVKIDIAAIEAAFRGETQEAAS
ncbi:VOC family protein [Acuticoccus sp. M5D2P5]|uniref:VOC family protein n=1 Tax=Acuticoccus kalidii TaxID=2910977 RepID=UPI001F2BBB8E|nr:VOC family protein [Acuticoccus kalidii]MCF3933109.1 VOC family protein [Acuticoccus kalidii]